MVRVKSSTQRMLDRHKQFRIAIFGKGIQGERWTEQLSFGNGKAVALNLIKHDWALRDLAG